MSLILKNVENWLLFTPRCDYTKTRSQKQYEIPKVKRDHHLNYLLN